MKKSLHTARVYTVGGRDGASRSADGRLDVQLSAVDGAGTGTNPEQLFAACWSASFLATLRVAASRLQVQLPGSTAVAAEVDLDEIEGVSVLTARFTVSLPSIDPKIAGELIHAASEACPYTRAVRGNIPLDVRIS